MMKAKKFILGLLSSCMIVCLMPAAAMAAEDVTQAYENIEDASGQADLYADSEEYPEDADIEASTDDADLAESDADVYETDIESDGSDAELISDEAEPEVVDASYEEDTSDDEEDPVAEDEDYGIATLAVTNGFAKGSDGSWYYYTNGKIASGTNSVIKGTVNGVNAWWYVVGGKVQTSFTGLADYSNSNGWWYIEKGKVTFSHEGVEHNKNGWFYVKDSKVQFSYNGFAKNSNGWWYIEKGKVTFNKNSVIQDTNKKIDGKSTWWYVVGSKVQTSFTGLADYSNSNGWWYIESGKVTFSKETVAKNKNGWFYVKDSKVQFSYNGFAQNSNGWWYIENGKVTFNKNSVIKDSGKKINGSADWWYVVGSKVQTSFTGLADYSNSNGWWYIKNGKVDFTANTVAKNKNGWYVVIDGKVDFSFNGFASNSNGWWYIKKGKVDFSHTVSVETSMADQVLTLVNQERAKQGLSSLSMPSVHQAMATERAFELYSYFSHTRPDGTTCDSIFNEYGVSITVAGENIAYGQTSASSVMNSWMNSSGHKANILDSDYTNVGIACVKVDGVCYWEQLFTGSYKIK